MKHSLSILTMTAVIGSGLALAGAATAQQPATQASSVRRRQCRNTPPPMPARC